MEINEYKVRLAGTLNLSKGLVLGKDYDVTIANIETRKMADIPNDDGTCNRVYNLTVSNRSEMNIIAENDIIKGTKGSMSQKLRFAIKQRWIDKGELGEFEEYYTKQMKLLIDKYYGKTT